MNRISRRICFSFTRWPLLRKCQVSCRTPKKGRFQELSVDQPQEGEALHGV